MTATLDQAVKAPTFHPVSTSRKLKNGLATTLFTLSFAIAMIPLVWVIYTVMAKGIGAVTSSTWWSNSQAGVLPEEGRRCVPRDLRHAAAGRHRRGALGSLGRHGRDVSGRVRSGPVRQDHYVHGRHPRRGALDRGRALHLRAVDCDAGIRAVRLRRFAGIGVADAPRRRTQHRGDAAARTDELREASYALGIPKWKTILRSSCPPHCRE